MEPGKTSYRAVRAIGILLLLEVIGLVVLGGYEFLQVDWMGINLESPRHQAVEVAVFSLFVPSAILTLLSALSFLFLHRRGWLLAAIAQGLSLAVCLWLYSLFQPGYVYPIMAYCVLMILYLNSQDVRMVFYTRRSAARQKSGGVT
jgi:hypothetical protein